jgi:hypothetical protein
MSILILAGRKGPFIYSMRTRKTWARKMSLNFRSELKSRGHKGPLLKQRKTTGVAIAESGGDLEIMRKTPEFTEPQSRGTSLSAVRNILKAAWLDFLQGKRSDTQERRARECLGGVRKYRGRQLARPGSKPGILYSGKRSKGYSNHDADHRLAGT